MMDKRRLLKVVTIFAVALAVLCALYIMINGLGLSDKYDFGAGAYYYTDIPDYGNVIHDDAYEAQLPYWIYVVLFLSWGFLMYRLWVWIDKKR
ncbi:MAG: hypothetical protein II613_07355 [Bacteroidales bacterium]|nr:hypothetical protein [Bacteroidales bacterium]